MVPIGHRLAHQVAVQDLVEALVLGDGEEVLQRGSLRPGGGGQSRPWGEPTLEGVCMPTVRPYDCVVRRPAGLLDGYDDGSLHRQRGGDPGGAYPSIASTSSKRFKTRWARLRCGLGPNELSFTVAERA